MRTRAGDPDRCRQAAWAGCRVSAALNLALTLLAALVLRANASGRGATKLPAIWKSETTGNEYQVALSGNTFRANWIRIPPVLASHGAYVKTECHRQGAKWVGTSSSLLPCSVGEGSAQRLKRWCPIETRTEIESISVDRIAGRGQTVKKVDCETCKLLETGWAPWVWVPEK